MLETTADLEVLWARRKHREGLSAEEPEGRMNDGLKALLRRMVAQVSERTCSTSKANRDVYRQDPQHHATQTHLPERKMRSQFNLDEFWGPSLKEVIKAKPSLWT